MRREKKVVAKRVCLDFSIEMFSGGENAPVHLCCQKRNKQYELFWDQKKYLTVNIWHQNANPEQESLRHSVGTSYSSCLEEPFINGFMVLPSTGTTEGCRLVLNAEKKVRAGDGCKYTVSHCLAELNISGSGIQRGARVLFCLTEGMFIYVEKNPCKQERSKVINLPSKWTMCPWTERKRKK